MKPDIEAIRARAEKATAGPWEKDGGRISTVFEGAPQVIAEIVPWVAPNGRESSESNADFIAHSRSDIDALLAYIDSLERVREK